MAKDPAFLFYPGDYVAGTMHLDFECKGAYVDLLMLQFNKDHMTIHMIKHVLGHKFDHIWPQIADKFKSDGSHYWNERLKSEKEKRVKYTESRRSNRIKEKKDSNHMIDHMENRNENRNSIKKGSLRENKKVRGVSFSEDGLKVIFPDGSSQELGQGQQLRFKEGNYQPYYVYQGIIE